MLILTTKYSLARVNKVWCMGQLRLFYLCSHWLMSPAFFFFLPHQNFTGHVTQRELYQPRDTDKKEYQGGENTGAPLSLDEPAQPPV
jgi:hypothetical protein